MIYYVGDLHGITSHLSKVLIKAEARGVDYLVQVGDFGTFFPTKNARKRFFRNQNKPEHWTTDHFDQFLQKRAKKGKWKTKILTCGGNHDNWNVFDQLWEDQGKPDMVELYPNSGVYYVTRGSVVELNGIKHLFMGGAESTDAHRRTPNLDWWDREEPNGEEFDRFFENLNKHKPDTVVSHDAPVRVNLPRKRRRSSFTPNTMEKVLKLSDHSPRRWYFGHHHKLDKWKIQGTKYFCCGLHGQYWERG